MPSDVEVELVSVGGCDAFTCGLDDWSGMLGCGGVEYLSGAVEVPGGGGCSHDHFGDDEPGRGCAGAWGQVEHSRGGEQSAGLSGGCGGCQGCPQQVLGVTGALCLADTGEHGLTGTDEVTEFSLPGRHPPLLDCVAVADLAGLDTPLLSVIDRMDEHAPIPQGGNIKQVGITHRLWYGNGLQLRGGEVEDLPDPVAANTVTDLDETPYRAGLDLHPGGGSLGKYPRRIIQTGRGDRQQAGPGPARLAGMRFHEHHNRRLRLTQRHVRVQSHQYESGFWITPPVNRHRIAFPLGITQKTTPPPQFHRQVTPARHPARQLLDLVFPGNHRGTNQILLHRIRDELPYQVAILPA